MAQSATLLIVEDDAAIRRLLRVAAERAHYKVIEAKDAREGLSMLDIARPDAVLLDLGLPDRDGLELVQLVRAKGAALVIISARTDTTEKVAALDLGADDYVTKPFDTEELLARVRAALRHRDRGEIESAISAGDVEIDLTRRRVRRSGVEVHLTPKEYGILAVLARSPDRVIGHANMLRDVWGPAQEANVEYLRIAIRGLRQKLEPDPARPSLIINEPGVGYRLRVGACVVAAPGR